MRSSPSPPAQVLIGAFAFDAARRQLVGAGGAVELPSKEFELLSLLVAKRPHVVSKDEIRDALWPRTVVTDASLTSLVKELRTQARSGGTQGPDPHGARVRLRARGRGCGAEARRAPRLVRGGDGDRRSRPARSSSDASRAAGDDRRPTPFPAATRA